MKCSCASILFRRCTRFCMHTEFSSCGTRKPWTKQQPRLPIGPPHSLDPIHHSYFFFFRNEPLETSMNFLLQVFMEFFDHWDPIWHLIGNKPSVINAKNHPQALQQQETCPRGRRVTWFDLFFKRFSRVYGSASFQVRVILWSSCFFFKFDSDKHTFCLLYLGSWEIHWWHIWFTIF